MMDVFNGAAGVVIIKDGSLLMIQRGQDGTWALPAGKIDPGESPEEAAKRELWEEAGLTANKLQYLKQTCSVAKIHGKTCVVKSYIFHCDDYSGEIGTNAPGEILDVKFIPFEDIPNLQIFLPTGAVIAMLVGEMFIC